MKQHDANELCHLFGLGKLQGAPESVVGGLLHKMWYLKTDSGEYAVKQLNPHIMTRKNIREEYERTEKIAHAFKDKGIPAIASISYRDNSVIVVGNSHFIVYPWIDAKALDKDAISAPHAKKMGTLIARLHQIHLSFPDLPFPGGDFHPSEYFTSLSEKSLQANLPFAKNLHDSLDNILLWNKMYQEAIHNLNKQLIVCHSDLDQKNVLWTNDDLPILIDWESARLRNPTHEIITAALDWSGIASLNVDIIILRSVLNEYQMAGGKLTDNIQDAFYAQLGWLYWMAYNIERSLGEATTCETEKQLGIIQTEQTLKILAYLENNMNLWMEQCNHTAK